MTTEPATPFTRPLITTEEAERLSEALEKVGRDLSQTLADAATAMGEALWIDWEGLEAGLAPLRINPALPRLDMRGVMVHGYVPHGEA